jgi:hypothetical protein
MPQDYLVNTNTYSALLLGYSIAHYVRMLTPYGSMNQKNHLHDVGDSPPHACSTTKWGRWVTDGNQKTFDPTKEEQVANDWKRPMRHAAWTVAAKTGNCQDLAAVSYCCCRDYFPSTTTVSYVVSWAEKHAFVLVKDDTLDVAELVIDPWPQFPNAVLFIHHFCYYDRKNLEVCKQRQGIFDVPRELKRRRMDAVLERAACTSPPPPSATTEPCAPQFQILSCFSSDYHDVRYICERPVAIHAV